MANFVTVMIPDLDEVADLDAADRLVIHPGGDGPAQTVPAQAMMNFIEANGVGAVAAATAVGAAAAAIAAAEASGDVVFFDTHADAAAGVGALPADQIVQVLVDEDRGARRTIYRKEGGVLVYKQTATGAVRAVGDFGSLTAGATAMATVELAAATVGAGGVVFVDQVVDTGTAPADVGAVQLKGDLPVFHTPAGGGGRRVQNLPGRDPSRLMWGQERLWYWLEGIRTGAARSVVLTGDSRIEGYVGSQLATRLDALPNVSTTNMGDGGENIGDFYAGTGVFASNGKALSDVIAAAPSLLIWGWNGANEPLVGRSPEDFAVIQDQCLTAIRAALGIDECSILILTSNAMNADTGTGGEHPDEVYNAKLRPLMAAAAEKHGCALFDQNAMFPDAFADFGTGGWLDPARVHLTSLSIALYLALLWEFLVPPGIAADSSLMIADHVVADPPNAYPKADSLSRMTDGPANGFALTFNPLSTGGTFPIQFVFGISGAGAVVHARTATASNVWGNFCALSIIPLLQDQVAVATAITGFPFGRSFQRATVGYPHNGFVETFRDSINGGNGYQISISATADVAAQIRVSRSGAWGSWRRMGFNLDDLTDAADNAAASAAGVPSKGMYRNGGVVMVRTT